MFENIIKVRQDFMTRLPKTPSLEHIYATIQVICRCSIHYPLPQCLSECSIHNSHVVAALSIPILVLYHASVRFVI